MKYLPLEGVLAVEPRASYEHHILETQPVIIPKIFHVVGDLFDIPHKILVIDGQTCSPSTGRPAEHDGRFLPIYHSMTDVFILSLDDVIRRLQSFIDGEDAVVVYHGQSIQPHLVGKHFGVENLVMTLSADRSDPQYVNDLAYAYGWDNVYATVEQDPPTIVDYDDRQEVQRETERRAAIRKTFRDVLNKKIKVVDRPDIVIVDAVFDGMSVDEQLHCMEADSDTVKFVQDVLKYLPNELSERENIAVRTTSWVRRINSPDDFGVMVKIPLDVDKVLCIYKQKENLSVWMGCGSKFRSTSDVKVENLAYMMDLIRAVEDELASTDILKNAYKAGFLARRAALRVDG